MYMLITFWLEISVIMTNYNQDKLTASCVDISSTVVPNVIFYTVYVVTVFLNEWVNENQKVVTTCMVA